MKNNKGNVAVVILGGILAVIVLLGGSLFFSGVGFNNTSVQMENGIKAQFEQNKNNYSSYFNKLKEAAQIPEMYTEDLKKVYDSAISNRYGKDGSKAQIALIKEMNPNFDPSMYNKIMQIIEAGRNSFEADQKTLLDKKMAYENYLQTFPNNVFAGFLGFPKIKLEDYKIVVAEGVQEAFKKGEAGPINLRK